ADQSGGGRPPGRQRAAGRRGHRRSHASHRGGRCPAEPAGDPRGERARLQRRFRDHCRARPAARPVGYHDRNQHAPARRSLPDRAVRSDGDGATGRRDERRTVCIMKTADIPDVAAAAAQPAMRHEPDRPAPAPEPEIAEASEALATAEAPARWSPPAKSWLTRAVIVALLAGAILAILYAWQLWPLGGRYEKTDDAYVRGQTTVISPQVSGYVADVPVRDFQDVKGGDVLVRIEDSIYGARVAQARANILTQMANLDNSAQAQRSKEVSTLSQDAGIVGAQAELVRTQADWSRLEPLVKNGWATRAQEDQARAALRRAEAQLRQAQAARQIGTE